MGQRFSSSDTLAFYQPKVLFPFKSSGLLPFAYCHPTFAPTFRTPTCPITLLESSSYGIAHSLRWAPDAVSLWIVSHCLSLKLDKQQLLGGMGGKDGCGLSFRSAIEEWIDEAESGQLPLNHRPPKECRWYLALFFSISGPICHSFFTQLQTEDRIAVFMQALLIVGGLLRVRRRNYMTSNYP